MANYAVKKATKKNFTSALDVEMWVIELRDRPQCIVFKTQELICFSPPSNDTPVPLAPKRIVERFLRASVALISTYALPA